ncbi:hypothetical protein RJ641_021181 [Dillenia turbinata]|uniref:glutamine synthetase n=1 Tax=Dillenia turbinata TaxID=194707 RepID=A0AAN8YVF2_9MAGN
MANFLQTITKPIDYPSELPKWNCDGSSTGQAPGEDSEAGEPIPTSKHQRAAEIFSNQKVIHEVPWYASFGCFNLVWHRARIHIAPKLMSNGPWDGQLVPTQGSYYCAVGATKSFGRDISDAHYKACLYAGINTSGTNGKVMPGQWEYQVGPSVGIEAGDHIWCSPNLLERITEQAGVVLKLDPTPIEVDWNGAGYHTNFTTKSMREDGDYEAIEKAILNLSLHHKEYISAYREGNERRLTGKQETANINIFSWGVANHGCSICVGRETEKQSKDLRPTSNMDPYVVTSLLAETTLLWEPTLAADALAA